MSADMVLAAAGINDLNEKLAPNCVKASFSQKETGCLISGPNSDIISSPAGFPHTCKLH